MSRVPAVVVSSLSLDSSTFFPFRIFQAYIRQARHILCIAFSNPAPHLHGSPSLTFIVMRSLPMRLPISYTHSFVPRSLSAASSIFSRLSLRVSHHLSTKGSSNIYLLHSLFCVYCAAPYSRYLTLVICYLPSGTLYTFTTTIPHTYTFDLVSKGFTTWSFHLRRISGFVSFLFLSFLV